MQGQGNDFVVIDGVRQEIVMTAELARRIADRHFGIGCDQILLVERPTLPGNDFRYRIWNSDGGEVEQCGNGSRCFARFVLAEGLTAKHVMRVETASGVITPHVEATGRVTVDMGRPRFEPREIPFRAETSSAPGPSSGPLREHSTYQLEVGGETLTVSVVSMGNPHAVQVVADVDAAPVRSQGPLIENHPDFPRRVNAGYLQVISRSHIRLRVWERGAGETLACGTGACAAVVAGIRRGLIDSPVTVTTLGGDLTIEWSGNSSPVMMAGDAVRVFDGEIEI
jgi:diaminopimelate epimerase